jgi:A/G-specific adenine glycosylase
MIPQGVLEKRDAVRHILVVWGRNHQHLYPWRRNRSPYEVLVAEVLLKRTTARAVERVYERFLRSYPGPEALVSVPIDQVARDLGSVGLQWQRARALKRLAVHLIEHEGTEVPRDLNRLLRVPSLGDYGARAVLSFGYGVPLAVVDGNVRRILERVFHRSLPRPANTSFLQKIADALLPPAAHQQFNFAMLDLGRSVCRPVNPRHDVCPLKGICDFAQLGPQLSHRTRPPSALRAARLGAGLSLIELARQAGVGKLTIINIEAGRTTPRERTGQKLASILGLPVSQLVPRRLEGRNRRRAQE